MPQRNIADAFVEYKERLVSFVRKRLAVKDEAEDIVQEIFYQFSRIDDTAKPVEQTAAWLFRVAKNMIINWRKKKRDIPFSILVAADEKKNEAVNSIVDILSADETTPETELLRSLVWKEIESALDELPPPQRDIFIQTEFLGIPVKEISQKTGVQVNTLLSRKHYAVLHLRKRLENIYNDFWRTERSFK
jgi:RNA polymerase sigma factor (sigma-70 family)